MTQPAPTVPPTTAETVPETEPEEPLPAGGPVSLMGVDTASFLEGDTLYVRAEDYAQAFGLELTQGEEGLLLDGQPLPEALIRRDGNYVPVGALSGRLGYEIFVDEALDGRTYVYPAPVTDIPEGVHVPVLMYHAVSDDLWGIAELFVSPADLEDQLAYLTENGYDPIFFSDLANLGDYDKPVILTFDDGYRDNYENLFPLLQKYQVKATVFMITGYIGTSRSLTAEQLREMSQSGLVSIQSHTETHCYLDECSEETLVSEMENSQLAITRITGIRPNVLCYPTGRYNALVKEVAARYYDYALTMSGSEYVTGSDPFAICRYYVSRYTGLGQFAGILSGAGEKS